MPSNGSSPAASTRVVVAANPRAGFGRLPRAGEEVAALLRMRGFDVQLCEEDSYRELLDATSAALRQGCAALVVVGGDGMVHLGAQVLAGSDIPLGIVATGTGNDAAAGLGLPVRDLEAAVDRAIGGIERGARCVDLGRIVVPGEEDRYFFGVLSAGFDAAVNERANRMRRPRGASRYVLALLGELMGLRPVAYTLVVDGVAETTVALLASVANNRSLGGGMRIAPGALLDDGEFELVIVAPLGRLAFLRFFPRVFRGTHVALEAVSIRRCRSVRLEADEPLIGYADGERVSPLPLLVEVAPGALRVLA